jgi:hypothetical protein
MIWSKSQKANTFSSYFKDICEWACIYINLLSMAEEQSIQLLTSALISSWSYNTFDAKLKQKTKLPLKCISLKKLGLLCIYKWLFSWKIIVKGKILSELDFLGLIICITKTT